MSMQLEAVVDDSREIIALNATQRAVINQLRTLREKAARAIQQTLERIWACCLNDKRHPGSKKLLGGVSADGRFSFPEKAGSLLRMSTITAILEADNDGTLHLPLPLELRHGKVRVEAKLEAAPGESSDVAEAGRQRRLMEIMERIRARNPFRAIKDPAAWQREMREDVKLPGRD